MFSENNQALIHDSTILILPRESIHHLFDLLERLSQVGLGYDYVRG